MCVCVVQCIGDGVQPYYICFIFVLSKIVRYSEIIIRARIFCSSCAACAQMNTHKHTRIWMRYKIQLHPFIAINTCYIYTHMFLFDTAKGKRGWETARRAFNFIRPKITFMIIRFYIQNEHFIIQCARASVCGGCELKFKRAQKGLRSNCRKMFSSFL